MSCTLGCFHSCPRLKLTFTIIIIAMQKSGSHPPFILYFFMLQHINVEESYIHQNLTEHVSDHVDFIGVSDGNTLNIEFVHTKCHYQQQVSMTNKNKALEKRCSG